ncbi:MAG: hypothetical protein B6I20_00730 [Bacteroidetes bacterium 4572_117]|nr:MAG: hypothetical protein B6I20_00730 [Bacteroidetes bacterium 4572_117]
MKTFSSLSLVLVLILGFSYHTVYQPHNKLIPNAKAVIKFKFVNCTDTSSYKYFYNTQLPFNQYRANFTIHSDTLFNMEIKEAQPTIINFHDNKAMSRFMGITK